MSAKAPCSCGCSFSEMSMVVEMLPIFYTQRDNLFYTAWAFALPATLLRVPFSLAQSLLWSLIIYWSCGLAPTAARFFTFWLLTFLTHLVSVWGRLHQGSQACPDVIAMLLRMSLS